MHFDGTFSLGNMVTMAVAIGVLVRMDRIAAKFLVEHEILISDYCKRIGVEVKDLPTRMRGLMK
jgi:hypothetical protein